MKKVQRNLQVRVADLLKNFPAVVLIGARQAGKTELAKTIAPKWRYLDLENPTVLDRIQIDLQTFFSENPHSLILDEAQEYPEIFKVLRGVIDQDRDKKGRFLITGSSSPHLLRNISESLAGRVATLEVGTLKANEYYEKPLSRIYELFKGSGEDFVSELQSLKPQLSASEMRSFWFHGGYPEPVLARDDLFFSQWMDEYQKTYIQRDIKRLFPRIDDYRYRKLISLLGELSGTILNRSELAGLLDVSQPTISQYLNIADGTFIWRTLPSFEKSKAKSVVKMPKGHIRDPGLLHHLLRVSNLEMLLNHPSFGRSFESFVIEEILKGLTAAGINSWNYYYYRTRSRAEIDLILEGKFGVIPLEIKFSSQAQRRDIEHLNDFVKENKLDFGLLVNQSDQVEMLNDKIVQIPLGLL